VWRSLDISYWFRACGWLLEGVRMEVCARKREVAAAAYDPVVPRLCLGLWRLIGIRERG